MIMDGDQAEKKPKASLTVSRNIASNFESIAEVFDFLRFSHPLNENWGNHRSIDFSLPLVGCVLASYRVLGEPSNAILPPVETALV